MRRGITAIVIGCYAGFFAMAQDRDEPEWYREEASGQVVSPVEEPAFQPPVSRKPSAARGYNSYGGTDKQRLEEERLVRARQLIHQRELLLAKQRAMRIAARSSGTGSLRYFQPSQFSISMRGQ